VRVSSHPDVREKFTVADVDLTGSSTEQLAATIKSEIHETRK
jgi:hypothetical protein